VRQFTEDSMEYLRRQSVEWGVDIKEIHRGRRRTTVSTLAQKFRDRRNAARRARAIERALSHARSQTMRDEILTIANRDL
jgi:hypothetical protein